MNIQSLDKSITRRGLLRQKYGSPSGGMRRSDKTVALAGAGAGAGVERHALHCTALHCIALHTLPCPAAAAVVGKLPTLWTWTNIFGDKHTAFRAPKPLPS